MKTLILATLFLSLSAWSATAFLKGQYTSGMNRICIYDHLGSDYFLTIKSYEVCPVSIEV